MNLLIVHAGGATYGLAARWVREVAEIGSITPVPGATDRRIAGLTRVRGRWLPVIDVPGAGRMRRSSPAVLVVVGSEGADAARLGVRAEAVGRIVQLEVASGSRRPDSEPVEVDGDLVHWLDPAVLFGDYDFLRRGRGGSMAEYATPAESVKLVTFRIGSEEFGLEVMDVFEVLEVPKLRKVPNVPEFVEGLAELRETVVPVIDLRKRLGVAEAGDPSATGRMLVATLDDARVGLLVDDVPGVVELPRSAVTARSGLMEGWAERFLRGIARRRPAAGVGDEDPDGDERAERPGSDADAAGDAAARRDGPDESDLIILLDLREILTSDERIELGRLVEEAQAMAAGDRPARSGKRRKKKRGGGGTAGEGRAD